MTVDDVVAKLEEICASLPGGGERRLGQLDMAKSVAQVIADKGHLIARAGTGTGKSLAYLVPAIMSRQTTVIATATKALQDQLADKDLPFLDGHLSFEWAILKGRSNYVCRQRVSELQGDRQMALDGVVSKDLDAEIDKLVEWADDTETGDRAELDIEPSPSAWSALSVTSDECPGSARCPAGESCFAEQAKRQAAGADLIVVNTHLYGIHLATAGAVLPDHSVVVIDEAHQLEDVISATAGVELSGSSFLDLARRARRIVSDDALADRIQTAGRDLDDALHDIGAGRVTLDRSTPLGEALRSGRDAGDALLSALRNISQGLSVELSARKERSQQGASNLLVQIDTVWAMTDDDVAFVSGPPNRLTLRVAPIDVGATLQDTLWPMDSVILTSATIPEVLPQQLGLAPDSFEFLDVGSPFDYESSALLYCAMDLPEPRSDEFEEATHGEIERLMVAAGGRTLALFTSWRAMQNAVEVLRPRLPWEILAQGERPKPALLGAFRADPEASLFATLSFWQGVDVVGEALSLVIIDKLPFPRPDDPLLEARRERAGRSAFQQVDLPRAATMLAQGTGRLIRSAEDKGVVAVLDRRLGTSKSYRWALLEALPPYRRTRDRSEAEAFLRRLRDA